MIGFVGKIINPLELKTLITCGYRYERFVVGLETFVVGLNFLVVSYERFVVGPKYLC